jgi:hypothetical protein
LAREVKGGRVLCSEVEKIFKKTTYTYVVPKSCCSLSVKATHEGSIGCPNHKHIRYWKCIKEGWKGGTLEELTFRLRHNTDTTRNLAMLIVQGQIKHNNPMQLS